MSVLPKEENAFSRVQLTNVILADSSEYYNVQAVLSNEYEDGCVKNL